MEEKRHIFGVKFLPLHIRDIGDGCDVFDIVRFMPEDTNLISTNDI